MNRVLLGLSLVLTAGAGVLIGSLLLSVIDTPVPAGEPGAVVTVPVPSSAVTVPAPSTPPSPAPKAELLLLWTTGGLPSGFGERAAALNPSGPTSVVRGGSVGLTVSADDAGRVVDRVDAGFVIPLDIAAVRITAHNRVHAGSGHDPLPTLGTGQAVLTETGAGLRRLGPGGSMTVAGVALRVVAVVDDALLGGAEVGVNYATGASIGVTAPKYALYRHEDSRAALERRLRSALPAERPVRFRAVGETPYLRNGDAVLPAAQIKEVFGEFAYRPSGGREISVDPGWLRRNLVTRTVPVLGEVYCHRALMPAIEGAMRDLEAAALSHLVQSYEGCVNPHLLGGAGGPPSRHSWGAAIDVNFGANVTGVRTEQDPRLVEIMARWGFGNGDDWLVPDSGHFEYLGPPTA